MPFVSAALVSVVGRAAVDTAATVHKLRQTQINHYAAISRVALLAYDILLNLGREKEYVWDRKFRMSSVLYYMTRYPVVAYQVFNVCYSTTTPNCDAIDKATWAISLVLTRISISASFVLRVYAVMQRDFFGIFGVVLLSLIGVLAVVLDIIQDTEASCTQASNPLSTVLTFITLICFDILATGMLAWRIFQIIRDSGGFSNLSSSRMSGLLARSGAIYYIVITALQLGSVILYFLPQGVYSTVLNNYTLLLSSILVSRFLLDLRQMIHGPPSSGTGSSAGVVPAHGRKRRAGTGAGGGAGGDGEGRGGGGRGGRGAGTTSTIQFAANPVRGGRGKGRQQHEDPSETYFDPEAGLGTYSDPSSRTETNPSSRTNPRTRKEGLGAGLGAGVGVLGTGTMELIRDFEDPVGLDGYSYRNSYEDGDYEYDDGIDIEMDVAEGEGQVNSSAWPLEELVGRARVVEERLGAGGGGQEEEWEEVSVERRV
ncbi:uncharacterized protein STEHIDRAFT_121205 [Stereum hirsutum FP-91666 SS1]|uniref:uncharacterized protein n=1 Tax=Stereum hirsutum (strain FP-91666) TaxID=721885 RepID=UPI000440F4D7|nr:uncharacterized protein STEHIDRAFT_121205 [Stereum hirsutum FP-91666 SS1]EIM87610.1 hypothetical protein STEHIDRAFT_121205 [Stereum hirsutum FP-91666 SS1]